MSSKFRNKYRIESRRLKNWDYGNNGAYFITICTQNRKHFFGGIVNKEMVLNEIGLFAYNFWAEIPKHFPFIELGNFQIMPNHMHGILIINKMVVDIPQHNVPDVNALHCNVSNITALQCTASENLNNLHQLDGNNDDTLQCNASTNEFLSKISPKSGTISTIIRSYKSVVTKNVRTINSNFEWQSHFHDHVIRNSESFEKIQNYIENNPAKWNEDKFYN